MNKTFHGIYNGKRVLITGHTGFKGSWLSIWLRELGAEVIGYSLEPPSRPNNFMACFLEEKIINIHGNILDLEHLISVFKEYQPEFVFHMAAQSLVQFSHQEPKLTFDTNVGGTVNLLEAVRLTPEVKVVVNITSDKCYENREWVWGYRENDPMGGSDPYSASKGCAELVSAAYLRSFFADRSLGAASARSGNVIGGGDWGKDRLIPDCVRALIKDQPIGIRNPTSIRPWQHVLEPLSGYLWLGALLHEFPEKYSGSLNFGPDHADCLSVHEIVDKFIDLWGCGTWEALSDVQPLINPTSQYFLHEAEILKLCCDKAHDHLKWWPTLSMNVCLYLTGEWYKIFYTKGRTDDMYDICCNQICDYTEKARVRKLSWAA